MTHQTLLVIDFGSQYTQLIARRVREARVYCEIIPYDRASAPSDPAALRGIILSGGPASVYDPGAPRLPHWLPSTEVPVLAICYGMQLIAHEMGGLVQRAEQREYGRARIRVNEPDHDMFRGLSDSLDVWIRQSHFLGNSGGQIGNSSRVARALREIGVDDQHVVIEDNPRAVGRNFSHMVALPEEDSGRERDSLRAAAIRDSREPGDQEVRSL